MLKDGDKKEEEAVSFAYGNWKPTCLDLVALLLYQLISKYFQEVAPTTILYNQHNKRKSKSIYTYSRKIDSLESRKVVHNKNC